MPLWDDSVNNMKFYLADGIDKGEPDFSTVNVKVPDLG